MTKIPEAKKKYLKKLEILNDRVSLFLISEKYAIFLVFLYALASGLKIYSCNDLFMLYIFSEFSLLKILFKKFLGRATNKGNCSGKTKSS